jgi:hypothetical protein
MAGCRGERPQLHGDVNVTGTVEGAIGGLVNCFQGLLKAKDRSIRQLLPEYV